MNRMIVIAIAGGVTVAIILIVIVVCILKRKQLDGVPAHTPSKTEMVESRGGSISNAHNNHGTPYPESPWSGNAMQKGGDHF